MKAFLKKFGLILVLVLGVVIYLGLAYKSPFGDNSLISNLEPYPDTILYSFPAWNWARGNGWNLGVADKIVKISVPNTYGYFLAPFLKVFGDIRAFYIANVVLGLGAIVFFGLALKNIFKKNKWYIVGYSLFLLVTNFYFFNQPQLAMAENANYFLVAVFLFFLSLKFKWIYLIPMLIFVTVSLKLKNTNLVLGGSFAISFLIKIFWEKLRSFKIKNLLIIGGFLGVIMLAFYLPKILNLSSNAFNIKYLANNFNFYFSCLKGGECRNLWYWQRMVSWDIVVIFLLGVGIMLFDKKKRCLFLQLITPLVLLVLAMSVFVDTEGRHVEVLLPIMIMIGAMFIDKLTVKFKRPLIVVLLFLMINIFLTSYQPKNWEMKAISLKKQVGLNFRHREDPWNYLCLRMIDDFMVDKKQAYFGSFLPLYFFDAYGVDLNYLPLAAGQDFMTRGLNKHFVPPLKKIYDEKLNEGKEVYLSDYYVTNSLDAWRNEWNIIVEGKKIEKVYQSPMDNCNIYKISLDK